ncbi:disease resistance protein RPM1-like [Lotus japonicus]|uniref:disease resistance protein RPM1-like n=1 Tax=Lotus japonicus TaxID=34305 RepID=UPI002588ACA7|nr:disease resistance protein RPM1-like [Lotus japonicus]
MAEMAVSFAVDHLLPLLTDEATLLRGLHRGFGDIKDELESIQAFLKDADRRAAADEGSEGVKTWVKQVRQVAFQIEDIIDDYLIHLGQQQHQQQEHQHGCAAPLHNIAELIITLKRRHQIASEIQEIKSCVREIKDRSDRYGFQRQQQVSSSRENAKWYDPRTAALYIDEAEVLGFEVPKDELIGWLLKGRAERAVISVVGMGGQGKTTLAKKDFDNHKVIAHFDCHAWITVSQSYTVEGLLRDMLHKFCGDPPQGILQMDRDSLINAVRDYLQQKRYVVVFDDVWNKHFWDEIQFAVIDNKNGSRIVITTRKMEVIMSCKKSSLVQVHELQPLTQEQSLELFYKKAFRFDFDGCCPEELTEISSKIVKKCNGLPLAIVTIGGFLSTKEKNPFEWTRFSQNLSSELDKDSHLIGITKILGFSYDDLPYYLKSCFLYFGVYPEDYEVKSERLIRQWIAEGFVKEEKGKTLAEVAQGYLTELIHRSLVQVSSVSIDGKAEGCRVHDLIREMILKKLEDLSFCKFIGEDDQSRSALSGISRRLSIATTSNDLIGNIRSSHIRSLLFFTNEELPEYLVREIPTKYKLKVLDFQLNKLTCVPKDLGNLIHLKYLSLRTTGIWSLPKCIGKLQHLETLDLRGTSVRDIPKEVSKLRKLQHLLGDSMCLVQLKDGIGGMTSLQTLKKVYIDEDGGVDLIRELGKLRLLRELSLTNVRGEHGSTLSSSINVMEHLEKLHIHTTISEEIDLHLISPPQKFQDLYLCGKINRLLDWVPKLQNLVKLYLQSKLTDDESLQNMSSLLYLHFSCRLHSYEGETLYFHDGGFQKLKELHIAHLPKLSSILIDRGALPSLKMLELTSLPELQKIPSVIQHLDKLEVLQLNYMNVYPSSFPSGGPSIAMKQVVQVKIRSYDRSRGSYTEVIPYSRS